MLNAKFIFPQNTNTFETFANKAFSPKERLLPKLLNVNLEILCEGRESKFYKAMEFWITYVQPKVTSTLNHELLECLLRYLQQPEMDAEASKTSRKKPNKRKNKGKKGKHTKRGKNKRNAGVEECKSSGESDISQEIFNTLRFDGDAAYQLANQLTGCLLVQENHRLLQRLNKKYQALFFEEKPEAPPGEKKITDSAKKRQRIDRAKQKKADAQIKIAQCYRNHLANQLQKKIKAVVTIQTPWRGHLARQTHHLKTSSATNIQRVFRGHHERNALTEAEAKRRQEAVNVSSAIKIQALWRNHLARQAHQLQTSSVTKIQRFFRVHHERNALTKAEAKRKQGTGVQNNTRLETLQQEHAKLTRELAALQALYLTMQSKKKPDNPSMPYAGAAFYPPTHPIPIDHAGATLPSPFLPQVAAAHAGAYPPLQRTAAHAAALPQLPDRYTIGQPLPILAVVDGIVACCILKVGEDSTYSVSVCGGETREGSVFVYTKACDPCRVKYVEGYELSMGEFHLALYIPYDSSSSRYDLTNIHVLQPNPVPYQCVTQLVPVYPVCKIKALETLQLSTFSLELPEAENASVGASVRHGR